MDQQDALDMIAAVRSGEFEDATVEVKRSQRGLARRFYETLSAFANRPGGGVVILGLDETQQFAVVGVDDVQTVMTELTDVAGKMVPPLSLDVAVVEVEGCTLIVAEVPECDFQHKPCYYGPSGMSVGSFLRVGNRNRRMTAYEVFSFMEGRGQPTFDRELVRNATMDDLDSDLVTAYLDRIKRYRSNVWQRLRLTEKDRISCV